APCADNSSRVSDPGCADSAISRCSVDVYSSPSTRASPSARSRIRFASRLSDADVAPDCRGSRSSARPSSSTRRPTFTPTFSSTGATTVSSWPNNASRRCRSSICGLPRRCAEVAAAWIASAALTVNRSKFTASSPFPVCPDHAAARPGQGTCPLDLPEWLIPRCAHRVACGSGRRPPCTAATGQHGREPLRVLRDSISAPTGRNRGPGRGRGWERTHGPAITESVPGSVRGPGFLTAAWRRRRPTLARRGTRSMDGGDRRRGLAWATAFVGLLVAGCGADRPTREGGTIAPEAFVEAYVELRRAAEALEDSAAWEVRKREILDARGLTEEALEAFVEARSADVVFLRTLWDTIQARLESADS